ncbi:Hypothetical predicted protein [Podarcis lilfordi]|uniref:Uncharacterized protein n=1 Tax=Podarcis lilfordi TaxID=74358 RepID=A0AA35KD47_9SAUR|nr:Hypothetical predicted protein [Podarcis lilfordi]
MPLHPCEIALCGSATTHYWNTGPDKCPPSKKTCLTLSLVPDILQSPPHIPYKQTRLPYCCFQKLHRISRILIFGFVYIQYRKSNFHRRMLAQGKLLIIILCESMR